MWKKVTRYSVGDAKCDEDKLRFGAFAKRTCTFKEDSVSYHLLIDGHPTASFTREEWNLLHDMISDIFEMVDADRRRRP